MAGPSDSDVPHSSRSVAGFARSASAATVSPAAESAANLRTWLGVTTAARPGRSQLLR
ncbi:hypothetical protein [Streptomyces sp. Y2F8-2]|uniref:hypothetical protein n=1 Tax=Streptomyces sp. Y2F8-2 TaxID=2759675 RepID=UPI0019049ACE|nr:hypothetical protein [Streptomyces sp. Y2F8-2]